MKTNRNVALDFIRVLSMIFVICAHTDPKPFAGNALLSILFHTVIITCNANFYMLSGQLNLRKTFETPQDYKRYYWSKFISIILPYVIGTAVLTLWSMSSDLGSLTAKSFLKNFYVDIMTENASIHLWYMFTLIGMLFSAPFLAKMLGGMKKWELHILFGASILWNIVSINLTKNIGVGFSYNQWLMSGWMISFFAGYYVSRVVTPENKKKWYLAGLIGFVINVLGEWLFSANYKHPHDLAVPFVLFGMAAYAFMQNEIRIKNEKLIKGQQFVAKHSFMVYILHWNVGGIITPHIIHFIGLDIYYLKVIITFVVTMAMSVVLDVCLINPLQRLLRRVPIK